MCKLPNKSKLVVCRGALNGCHHFGVRLPNVRAHGRGSREVRGQWRAVRWEMRTILEGVVTVCVQEENNVPDVEEEQRGRQERPCSKAACVLETKGEYSMDSLSCISLNKVRSKHNTGCTTPLFPVKSPPPRSSRASAYADTCAQRYSGELHPPLSSP